MHSNPCLQAVKQRFVPLMSEFTGRSALLVDTVAPVDDKVRSAMNAMQIDTVLIRLRQVVFSLAMLGMLAGALGLSPLAAQTPWQAAPATPATLPKTRVQSPSTKVVPLPPPPKVPPATANVQTPASVPLPTRDSDGGGLIPDQLSVPTARSQPSATGPSMPPLPNMIGSPAAPGGSLSALQLPYPNLPALGPTAATGSERPTSGPGARPSTKPPSTAPGALVSLTSGSPRGIPVTNDETGEQFNAGQLVAVVGNEHVLAGDMAGIVEPIIEKNRDKLRSSSDENRLRVQLTRQVFGQYVEIKAMYQEFFRDMVGTKPPSEVEEMKQQVVTKAGKIFFERQVPNMMKQYEVNDLPSLEAKLREQSQSLYTRRTRFIEQVLAQELERKYVPEEFEITQTELLDYYRKNEQKWRVPAKARWRQLTIRFDKHDNNRTVVEQLIKNLGNEVLLGGKRFEAAALQSSEGYTKEQGGQYDWTTQGSLKSQPIDQALFSLPLNRLSQVITDEIGMHIIEIQERTEGTTRSFEEVQAEIRQQLSDEKRSVEVKKFRRKVLDRTPIWTLWPEDLKDRADNVRPLSDAIGEDDTF